MIFWGNLCEESCFWNVFFGIQLFWSFALIHHLQFSSCNTRSNIEIAFRLTSVIHYAWWRNTRVSSSSHRWHVCEMWISQGWNAHHEIGHHGKDETQGAMPQCLAMVSLQHVLKTWFGGTFLSLEMMYVWYPQTYASTVPKIVFFHAQCLSYSRTSCIGEPFKFGQI